ncbi:MAG: hypothetical protein WA871_14575 [Candidatus Acidiferrales bacterium]
MTNNGSRGSHFLPACVLVASFAAVIFCAGARAQEPPPQTHTDTDASKIEVRNNAASLLNDLLGDEKNLSKILIIKRHYPRLAVLVKAISKTASDGADEMDAMAKDDKSLNLHALQLPPGEVATRAAIQKTKEHEILFSSGQKFEINLLLSQTDALDYGSHLAKIAAENSTSPEQEKKFHSLDVALNALFVRAVARIRALPTK